MALGRCRRGVFWIRATFASDSRPGEVCGCVCARACVPGPCAPQNTEQELGQVSVGAALRWLAAAAATRSTHLAGLGTQRLRIGLVQPGCIHGNSDRICWPSTHRVAALVRASRRGGTGERVWVLSAYVCRLVLCWLAGCWFRCVPAQHARLQQEERPVVMARGRRDAPARGLLLHCIMCVLGVCGPPECVAGGRKRQQPAACSRQHRHHCCCNE
jgi:hypothetical protein